MLIYGWNSKHLKDAPFPGQKCQNCDAEDCHILISASYAHIFWIPIFPYRKSLKIVCTNCEHAASPKSVSNEVRAFAKELKKKVRIPIWMFSGSGLVAGLIFYGIITSFISVQKELGLLENPEVNDLYYFYDEDETTEYKYYLRKVMQVRGDSVDIAPNSFQYNWEATALDSEDGFYDIYYTLHKQDLIDLYNDDVIRTVKRGLPEGNGFERELIYPDSLLQTQ